MGNRNLEKENMELRRQLEAVTGALDRIYRMTENAGFNIVGPVEHANAAQNPALATELLLDACLYLKDISKVSSAALAAVREPADHIERDLGMVGSPAWVSLTDEDRERVLKAMPDWLDGFLKKWGWLNFAKAIEDACREKNSNIGSPAGEGGEA